MKRERVEFVRRVETKPSRLISGWACLATKAQYAASLFLLHQILRLGVQPPISGFGNVNLNWVALIAMESTTLFQIE